MKDLINRVEAEIKECSRIRAVEGEALDPRDAFDVFYFAYTALYGNEELALDVMRDYMWRRL